MDAEVGDGSHGQVVLEALPVGAVVEGDVETELSTGVEEPFLDRDPPGWRG